MPDVMQPEGGQHEEQRSTIVRAVPHGRRPEPSGALIDPFAGPQRVEGAAGVRPPSVGMLWQRKWLALVVFLLFSAPVIAGIWILVVPVYTARAVIEVSPTIQRIIGSPRSTGAVPFYQQYLNSQAEEILGPVVLGRVLDDEKVRATNWYREKPLLGAAPSHLERLREDLRVGPRRNTSLVDVRMSGQHAGEVALIVNTVVDEYLKRVLEKATQSDDDVLKAVTDEYRRLQNEIKGLNDDVTRLGREIEYGDPDTLLGQQRNRLDTKRSELKALQDEIKIAEWRRAQVERLVSPSSQPGATPAGDASEQAPPYDVDDEWRGLDLAVKTAEDVIELEGHLGAEHPTMVRLRAVAEQARENRVNREAQLDKLWQVQPQLRMGAGGGNSFSATTLSQLDTQMAELEYAQTLKAEDIRTEQAQVEATAGVVASLSRVLDELRRKQDEYEVIRERKRTMELERRAPASIRPMSRAYPASQPDNGRRRLMLMGMALFGGMALGLAAAYLRASIARAVQDVSDLTSVVPLPFLGHMPLVRRAEARENAVRAEHVRMVRTALLRRLEEGHGNAVQITSAGPGTGKTTFAVMLADSLARCGKTVLLVDGDLRNPSVHKWCAIDLEPGLLGVLAAQAQDDEAIITKEGWRVSVLPAGRTTADADAELLANGVVARCVRRWREQFDVVLFDSSPVLPVADACILSRHVDGTILVVRGRHCQRADVADALAQLGTSGGTLLGMVFVGTPRTGSYRNGYYDDYYAGAQNVATPDVREG